MTVKPSAMTRLAVQMDELPAAGAGVVTFTLVWAGVVSGVGGVVVVVLMTRERGLLRPARHDRSVIRSPVHHGSPVLQQPGSDGGATQRHQDVPDR